MVDTYQDEYGISSKALYTASAPLDYLNHSKHIKPPKKVMMESESSGSGSHLHMREVNIVGSRHEEGGKGNRNVQHVKRLAFKHERGAGDGR